MIPEPILLSRSGLLPRLMMQLAASALLTVFYSPGGIAGWGLDLLLRLYLGLTRRSGSRAWSAWWSGSRSWLAAPVLARVSARAAGIRPATRLSELVEK